MFHIILSFLAFLVTPIAYGAIELKPWFENDFEAEFRVYILYQTYDSFATSDKHCVKHKAHDTFSTLNVSYPFKRYLGQFEITGAHTRHQSCRIDNFRISGGYQWLNDEEDGDLISLVTTIILTEPLGRALHDVSSFHHGHLEGEFCISYGKKYGCHCSKDYYFRWWNVFGFGSGEEGSPWYRADAACEYKYGEIHHLRGFVNTLWGVGGKSLHPCHFKGYGPVRHKSVDVGVRYSYEMGYWGTVSLQYARRVYAHNFPEDTNLFLFEYYLPFEFQVHTTY